MADPRFFTKKGPFTVKELCEIAQAELKGNCPQQIDDVAPLDLAGPHTVSFLDNRKYIADFSKSKAGLCLVHPEMVDHAPQTMALLVTETPYMGYAKIASAFYTQQVPAANISTQACVDETAQIGEGVVIEAGSFIGKDVVIGASSWIKANAVLNDGVKIGESCVISQNVTITHSLIGNHVTIHPGCQIGQDGFGFASGPQGHMRIPQLGRVIIQDHVNIGANTTIDRGAGPDTLIGAGTQIDNLVQIGHNVQIGMGCVIVSQVGISGSTKLGNFVVCGGQAGIAGHLQIGDGAVMAAKAGVMKNIPAGETWGGFPAIPQKDWLRQVATLNKITRSNNRGQK